MAYGAPLNFGLRCHSSDDNTRLLCMKTLRLAAGPNGIESRRHGLSWIVYILLGPTDNPTLEVICIPDELTMLIGAAGSTTNTVSAVSSSLAILLVPVSVPVRDSLRLFVQQRAHLTSPLQESSAPPRHWQRIPNMLVSSSNLEIRRVADFYLNMLVVFNDDLKALEVPRLGFVFRVKHALMVLSATSIASGASSG